MVVVVREEDADHQDLNGDYDTLNNNIASFGLAEKEDNPTVSINNKKIAQISTIEDTHQQGNLVIVNCPIGQHEEAQSSSSSTYLIHIISILCSIGSFLFGYDTSIVSGAIVFLRTTHQLNHFWQELVVSITLLGAWLFSLMAGPLSDSYGRRTIILISSIFFAVGSIIMGFAATKWPLLLGRLTVGVAIGLASTVIPVYIAEVAPSNIRGVLMVLNNSSICFGQLCAAISAGVFSFDHDNGWRWMLSIAAVPAIFQFVGFLFIPESPRWLIQQGHDRRAMNALMKIRGSYSAGGGQEIVQHEFNLMRNSIISESLMTSERTAPNEYIIISILRLGQTRRALFIGCLLGAMQQLSGINLVMYYTATIVEMSGVSSPSLAIWLTVPVTATLLIFCLLGCFLVDRMGRRMLTLTSLFGVIIALVLLGTGFYLTSLNEHKMVPSSLHNALLCNDYVDCQTCLSDSKCGGFCYSNEAPGLKGLCIHKGEKNNDNNFNAATSAGLCSISALNNATLVSEMHQCPSSNNSQTITFSTWVILSGLVLYLAAFAPGMASMPWTINSEIYPMWARGVCYSIATSVIWLLNMIVSFTFLTLTELLTTHGTFYLYSIVAFIGWCMIVWKLPETRGRTLEEVSNLFKSAKF